jgi:hypothetical protein
MTLPYRSIYVKKTRMCLISKWGRLNERGYRGFLARHSIPQSTRIMSALFSPHELGCENILVVTFERAGRNVVICFIYWEMTKIRLFHNSVY